MAFNKIVVNNELTIETIGYQLILLREEFELLLRLEMLPTEVPFYDLINEKITKHWVNKDVETQNRRNVIWGDECISTLQFLYNRNPNTLVVNMRSASFTKFNSDLAYFITICNKYDLDKIIINYGSLHHIIGEVS